MKVAILGCGPTGLIAAHAAANLGHEITIYSRKMKSHTFGAMYLHQPIPGVSPDDPELEVNIVKLGTREGYARSVYGDENAEVSWDKFVDGPAPAWDLAAAYSKLWDRYAHRIFDVELNGNMIDRIGREHRRVFSTVPTRTVLCMNWLHKFSRVDICVIHGRADDDRAARNVMYYNGLPADGLSSWYRYSVIQGYQSWEYSRKMIRMSPRLPPAPLRVDYGIKPLATDCNCRPWVHRLGRFGKWNKHAFTHHAYAEVVNALLRG